MATATETREHPILFKGHLVRAILEGRKTVTRRVIRPQPCVGSRAGSGKPHASWKNLILEGGFVHSFAKDMADRCPYGQPGDRLWVRETWKATGLLSMRPISQTKACSRFVYAADGEEALRDKPIRWKPSIHMPRWASRIDLEVTAVRVERIQEITTEQIIAEGIEIPVSEKGTPLVQISGKHPTHDYLPREGTTRDDLIRAWFASSWDTINAARGYGWKANPWVWVIEFRKVAA